MANDIAIGAVYFAFAVFAAGFILLPLGAAIGEWK